MLMKKLFAMVMAVLLTLSCFAGCVQESGSDLKDIQNKGKIVVGITEYAPMDFKDENGNWTGFDAELATLFAKELGVEIEFFVIADWGKKFVELETKQIDVIWNGMTISDDVLNNTSCSIPYVLNAQVIVMKADKIAQYPDVASMKNLTVAVENDSAGEDAAKAAGFTNLIEVQYQDNALMEVAAGTADACVIDITMANNMTGAGTSYADLGKSFSLTEEEYGVGFRKDSDVTAKLNDFLKKLMQDGTLQALADKYDLTLADIK
ncbi:MAG: transporter substrate-binding domain-containing protein [Oscillospiraceae bacterium]|nr:transporter substrate-binding domain-containing protein [Oscillospiraceae bacterium]